SGVQLGGAKVNLNCGVAQSPAAPTADPKDVPDPYEARGPEEAATAQTSSQSEPAASPSSAVAAPAPTSPAGSTESDATEPLPPIVLSARWERSRVPAGTEVKLTAMCSELAGQAATFTIKDANSGEPVATLSSTCDASA